MAVLVVLEAMTPAERVAFILHDVFGSPSPRSPASSAARRRPVAGAVQTGRFLAGVARTPGLTILERTVNGQPGVIAQRDGSTVTVFAFEVAAERVARIWAIRNSGPGAAADPRRGGAGPRRGRRRAAPPRCQDLT